MTEQKELIAKAPRGRTRRTPVGKRNVLTVTGKDPNYVYRIVNDSGDRIEQFKEAGYEIVEASEVRVGDRRVNQATPEGSKAQVSVGQGQKAMVMRIHKDWYEEDQDKKMQDVRQLEESLKKPSGDYGKISIER